MSLLPLSRQSTLEVDKSAVFAGLPAKAGLFVDGDFTTPRDGDVGINTTAGQPEFRSGGIWMKVPVFAGNNTAITANGTLVTNRQNVCDATTAALTMLLPTGQPVGTWIEVEKKDVSPHTVSIVGNIRGVPSTTLVLTLQQESLLFVVDAAGSWSPFAGNHTLSSLDARYLGGGGGGGGGGTANGVTAQQLLHGVGSSPAVAGYMFKRDDSTWALFQPYGSAQAFEVLSPSAQAASDVTGDYNVTTPGENPVLFRVDAYGGIGTVQGFHCAPGLRNTHGGATPIGIWVQLGQGGVDAAGVMVTMPAAGGGFVSPGLLVEDSTAANRFFSVDTTGALIYSAGTVVAAGIYAGASPPSRAKFMAGNAATVAETLQAAAGQSAKIWQVLSSAGAVLEYVDFDGLHYLKGNPVAALGAVPKQYVDAQRTDTTQLLRLTRNHIEAERVGGGQASIDYADAAEFVETWADLTTGPWQTADVAVSANKLFPSGVANPSAAIHTLAVPTGGKLHYRTILHFKASAGSTAGALFGIDCGTAGHAPAASSPDAFTVGFLNSNTRLGAVGANLTGVTLLNDGQSAVGALPTVDTDYLCSCDIDENYVSLTMSKVGAPVTDLFGYKISRAALATAGKSITGILLYVADSRTTSGHSFGPVVAVSSLQQTRTKAVGGVTVEGIDGRHIVTRSPSDATRPFMVLLPANYDARRPSPLVIMPHQAGTGTVGTPLEAFMANVTAALLGAGYMVMGVADGTGAAGTSDSFGNQASLDNHVNAYKYVRDRFNTGSLYLVGPSMGTLIALNLMAQRKLPTPAAFASICGGYSLSDIYGRDTAYDASINVAFPSGYAGYDPGAFDGSVFRGVPMHYYAAGSDTLCPVAQHGQALITAVAPYTEDAVLSTTASVGHLDAATYQGSNILAFFESHRGAL